jgi:hypothetical protein
MEDMRLFLGTALLFSAFVAGCDKKKEIPADADAIVADYKDELIRPSSLARESEGGDHREPRYP